MRLSEDDCRERLATARHGTLATVHPDRGVDAVPVVFVLDGDTIFVPVDTVKAKSGARLRRLVNIDSDPRCVLLVEHWADDWSELWWVRAHGEALVVARERTERWLAALRTRYRQYAAPDSIAGGIEIAVTRVTGWRAGDSA